MIELKNVERSYKTGHTETWVLRRIGLTIHQGEFITVMGPSGAGKSSLLNVLALLDDSWLGEYWFGDAAVHALNRKQRADLARQRIGMVFQSYHLLDDLTVAENIDLPLSYKNLPSKERAGMVADTLPPSKHPTAGEYRWTVPPRNGFPPLPAGLLALWRDWETTQHMALALCPWYSPPKPRPAKAHRAVAPGESVIQQFNAVHDPAAILETHGYGRRGRRFASPETGHAAGITLLDDGRAYCHHQGDPLATGRALDSFDLFRILDHNGDWREAVKAAAAALGMGQSRAA